MKTVQDSSFSGLQTALDKKKMLKRIRQSLPECANRLELVDGKIEEVYYKQSSQCSILYELDIRNRETGQTKHQLLCGRIFRQDQRVTFPAEALLERYRQNGTFVFPSPLLHLADLRMILYPYPIDPSLPSLFDANDKITVRRALNPILTKKNMSIEKVRIKPLSYVPGMRASFLYKLFCQSLETKEDSIVNLIAKMHAFKEPARLFAGAWALWRSSGGRISLAPPIGYLPDLRLSLQEKVEGERLGTLAHVPEFNAIMTQTARQLALLHRLSLPLISTRSSQDEIRVVHRWATILKSVCPDLKNRVENLEHHLATELLGRTCVMSPVHGDFQHTNVLVDGKKIIFIDLDEMAWGDPFVDVARLLASLRVPALRVSGTLSGLDQARESFLDEYFKTPHKDRKRFHLFEASSLMITAASTFRQQRPDWRGEIEMILDEAERSLKAAKIQTGILHPPEAKKPTTDLSYEERIQWVRDPVYMQAALDPVIKKNYGASLESCAIHKEKESSKKFRSDLKLRGRLNSSKWKMQITVRAWKKPLGRRYYHRSFKLAKTFQNSSHAPFFPRLLAFLPPLSAVVHESPAGEPLSRVLGTSDGEAAVQILAQTLASFHQTPMEKGMGRPLHKEIECLAQDADGIRQIRPDLSGKLANLLAHIEKVMLALPERRCPVFRILRPQGILFQNYKIIFTEYEMVCLSHPYLDIGQFFSRLIFMGLTKNKLDLFEHLAENFKNEYQRVSSLLEDELTVFEAAALLRIANRQFEEKPDNPIAHQLLERASTISMNSV